MPLLVLHCCLLRKEGARLSFHLCQGLSQLPCSSPRGVLGHIHSPSTLVRPSHHIFLERKEAFKSRRGLLLRPPHGLSDDVQHREHLLWGFWSQTEKCIALDVQLVHGKTGSIPNRRFSMSWVFFLPHPSIFSMTSFLCCPSVLLN